MPLQPVHGQLWYFYFKTFMLAGLASGITEAIIVNPFEVIKVKMQANRAHPVKLTT